MKKEVINKPIVSIETIFVNAENKSFNVVNTFTDINKFLTFVYEIQKHDIETNRKTTILATFGHKFFRWASNGNNKRFQILNKTPLNICDTDDWEQLKGYVLIHPEVKFFTLEVTYAKRRK